MGQHKLRFKFIGNTLFAFCSCLNFIRICRDIPEIKDTVECWKTHKWAWEEEAKHERVAETVVEEAHSC